MNGGIPFSIREPQVFSNSDSTPLVVSSTSFVELLRLSSDTYTEHRVVWEVETDRPCDLCLLDENEHVYMTNSVHTPPGCSIGLHGGEATAHSREFRVMIRSTDGLPVNVYRREIRATRLGVQEHDLTMTVLKSKKRLPPFETPIDLLVASSKEFIMEQGMFGLPLGPLNAIFGNG